MPILTAEERIGTKLAGKYRLDRILGRGGFGVVYAGVHELTGREIATKVLNHDLGDQEQFVKRFLQEARAAAALNHPNVVDVLDLGQDPDGTVFLVLELLTGRELTAVLDERSPLSVHETLTYLLPVMDALAKAHERGIVHRDLKPDNIFLHLNSKGDLVPKLLDFGIAKMSGSSATSTGMVIGTPHYMAPEQARGSKDVGPAADVWSMGVVLWRCLSSSVPFDADSPTGVLAAILTQRAPSVFTVSPNLPPHVAAAIDGALQHEVERRIPTMGALVALLRGDAAAAGVSGHGIRPITGPFQTTRGTPPTVNLSTPAPMHTPTGQVVEPPPKRGSGLVIGMAAAAALLLAGVGVVAAVALWPGEPPAETADVAAPEPEAPAVASPPAVEPPPAEPPAEPPPAEPAVAEPQPPPAPAAPPEPAEPERVASARPRHRAPVLQPQPRPLAPGPVVRPMGRSAPPRVGNQGAPILR